MSYDDAMPDMLRKENQPEAKCESCAHSGVCRFVKDYIRLIGQLPKPEGPFRVEARCEHFSSKPLSRESEMQLAMQRALSNAATWQHPSLTK
jgi:hypothetical protein